MLILSHIRVVDLDHLRLRGGVRGHTRHCEVDTDRLVLIGQKGAFGRRGLLTLGECLQSLHS